MTITLLLPPQPEPLSVSDVVDPFIDLLDPTDVESAMETLGTLQRLADTLTEHGLTPDVSAMLATNPSLEPIAYNAPALTVIATEGLMDVVRSILAAIRDGLTKLIEWFKSVFTRKGQALERKVEAVAATKTEAQTLQSSPTGNQVWEEAKATAPEVPDIKVYTYDEAIAVLSELDTRWKKAKDLLAFIENDPGYRTNPGLIMASGPTYTFQPPTASFPKEAFGNGWSLTNMISALDRWEKFLKSIRVYRGVADTFYIRTKKITDQATALEHELTGMVKPDHKLTKQLEDVKRAYMVLTQASRMVDTWLSIQAPVFAALNTTFGYLKQTLDASELKRSPNTK